MPPLKVLDLYSGSGGFSEAFKQRGHEVVTVDIDPRFKPDICIDILDLSSFQVSGSWDIILASPPCTEFTRDFLPWYNDPDPSLDLVLKTKEIINELKPRWWILENVKGSVKWIYPILGPVKKRTGSRYLWGHFPLFDCNQIWNKQKIGVRDRAARRALIPYSLSLNLCIACEHYTRRR